MEIFSRLRNREKGTQQVSCFVSVTRKIEIMLSSCKNNKKNAHFHYSNSHTKSKKETAFDLSQPRVLYLVGFLFAAVFFAPPKQDYETNHEVLFSTLFPLLTKNISQHPTMIHSPQINLLLANVQTMYLYSFNFRLLLCLAATATFALNSTHHTHNKRETRSIFPPSTRKKNNNIKSRRKECPIHSRRNFVSIQTMRNMRFFSMCAKLLCFHGKTSLSFPFSNLNF